MKDKLFNENNEPRRITAYVSTLGTTQLHLRSPLVVAWWSAAFPGFGHLLLSKYFRGFVLIFWEFFINTYTKINHAMVYTFSGEIEKAKEVLDLRLLYLYIPVYIFAIYDSYRTAADMNNHYVLAYWEDRNKPISSFRLDAMEVNYLDKRSPWLAIIFSLLMPGMGQLYIHRIVMALYVVVWIVIIVYESRLLEGIHYTVLGDITKGKSVLAPEWLMYMPSLYFFSMYDAYVNTVEQNKLFDREQSKFLRKEYQDPDFQMPEYS